MHSLFPFVLKTYREASFQVSIILFSKREEKKKRNKFLKFLQNFTTSRNRCPLDISHNRTVYKSRCKRRVVVTSSQDKLAISNRGLSSSWSQYRVYPSIYVSIRIIRGARRLTFLYTYIYSSKKTKEWNGRWRGGQKGRIEIGSIEGGQCEVVAAEKSCAIP